MKIYSTVDDKLWVNFTNTWIGISLSTFVLFITIFTSIPPKFKNFSMWFEAGSSCMMLSIISCVISSYLYYTASSESRFFIKNDEIKRRKCSFIAYIFMAIGTAVYTIAICFILWAVELKITAIVTISATLPAYITLKIVRFGMMRSIYKNNKINLHA
ncbi:MAG: hypothetical protein HZA77_02245 [Candidatus Schekmanbacteria bacterium]|nr:hypothetical protein [Candidatus Schekmanbacteria bacterium]